MRGMAKRQREVVIGCVMGDAYVQATGKRNARLRLEQGEKQKAYLQWKYEVLRNFMQAPPVFLKRTNPQWPREYGYYRCQTHASPHFGKLRRWFYRDGRKIVPDNIVTLLKAPQSLAVWYMDDGSLSHRDMMAEIYLSKYTKAELLNLLGALRANFALMPRVKIKKAKYPCLSFDVEQTQRLIQIVQPHIIPSMQYKITSTP